MLPWIFFLVLILGLLALDLGVLNRKAHVIHTREALLWTAFWIGLALVFNVFVYYFYVHEGWGFGAPTAFELSGREAALQYFTGYRLEKSLSLDNIFVIAMLFAYFKVPAIYQHRVLFWGILGALVMRGIMIALGVALIERLSWMNYVFGAILLLSALRMLYQRHDELDPERNLLVRAVRRFIPITPHYVEGHFITRIDGKRYATPLLLALIMVESVDLVFAVDSIPAVFAVTQDPFIVFTSNVFAILGLRSLYFALAGLLEKFKYLQISLVLILAYVGAKMILAHDFPIPIPITLTTITGILSIGIFASIIAVRREAKKDQPPE